MVGFAYVHTSDLHLGSGFGTMPEELGGRLIKARYDAMTRSLQQNGRCGVKRDGANYGCQPQD